MPVHSGVLILDKPRGPTSHDVVARVKRELGVRQVGHAGTLDPMATGVLVVAVGQATKLVPWLTAQNKTYTATIALGVETDTLDADGGKVRVVALSDELKETLSKSAGSPLAPKLQAALAGERVRSAQVPPVFAALKHKGQRAYVRARRREALALDARPVRVLRLDLLSCSHDPPTVTVVLEVGKGYYVRALARDFANGLGTVGHLTSLRRTASGSFGCDEALSLETSREELLASMLSLSRAAARVLPVARLTERGVSDAGHGRAVKPLDIQTPARDVCAWLDGRGELVAVGVVDADGVGRVLRGFCCT